MGLRPVRDSVRLETEVMNVKIEYGSNVNLPVQNFVYSCFLKLENQLVFYKDSFTAMISFVFCS